ncbi:DUF3570 domain-containing protein [Shewanella eurypsychrophilus]|uniref:DUF3570 domain-containing protein n=2 Tax=Shewanellaceae TaxID=267890 RepID=A0ABX6VCU2_9GAMM|nr:DUF3570 domain-containing protein [Shewanella sp. YLB-09]QPG60469.1 DUF3570 domain-containing protein [Shewanella eurypsychrophilus]
MASLSLLNAAPLPVVAQDKLDHASQLFVTQFDETSFKTDSDLAIDAAFLYYQEQDKVTAAEGIFYIEKNEGDKRVYSGKLVLDTLTGASANGAVPQDFAQTFTRPSGNGEYTIAAATEPLDDTFKDTRLQLSANWTENWSPIWTSNHGLYLSREFDYTSMGINTSLQRSFNKSNTQVSLAAAYYYDLVDPVGGRPVAMSNMLFRDDFSSETEFKTAFDKTRKIASTNKQTTDLSVGISQILTRYTFIQLSYNLSSLSGYMTDPYKILSVVDEVGTATEYRYESRPDERLKQSLYLYGKQALSTGVVDLSYRYSQDDWGVTSHTFETHYRYNFTADLYGQIHLRHYQQGAADFYTRYLNHNDALPDFATADYRLGQMNAYTLGLKLGHNLPDGIKAYYRLEYYQQRPESTGQDSIGQLANQDLYPNLKAIIFQLGFSF